MDAALALARLAEPVATRAQLLRAGASPRDLAAAVHAARLIRVRRGYYARFDADPMLVQAVRIGGRLGCISAAQSLGIWSALPLFPHVAMRHEASRLRSPKNRFRALTPDNLDGCDLHWWPLPEEPFGNVHTVTPAQALAHIARCQTGDLVIASFDSAVYQGMVQPEDVDRVFADLPQKYQPLREKIDGRCMSGIESMVRLMLLRARLPFELQVAFRGIGTVDFVVMGRVVVETDGRLGHDDVVSQQRDYERDAALIRLGYTVVRLNYAQVMFDPAGALATIVAAVRNHRGLAR